MRILVRLVAAAFVFLQLGGCSREGPTPDSADRAAATTAVQADPDSTPSSDCRLTMGWDPWPPFHYTGFGGELTGFDIELLQAMAADVGCELEFERDSWAALLAKVRDGGISLVTGATMTEARQAFAHFSAPVREEEFALFVRTGEARQWSGASLRALVEQGMRLGVTDAYVYGDAVQEVLDDPAHSRQVIRSRFGEANIGRLLDGEIDAIVEDVFAAATMIRRLGFEGAISRHPISLGSGGEVRIMYSKAAVPEELVARLDQSLARLRESGEYAALKGRYLD